MVELTTDYAPAKDEEAQSVLLFLTTVWRAKVRIAVAIIVCGLFGFLVALLQPAVYTARVTLLPQREQLQASLLSQVAAFTDFGIEPDPTFEQLYKRIVHSDRLLDELIDRSWTQDGTGAEVRFYKVFAVRSAGPNDARAREKLKRLLRKKVIYFSRDERTGFMVLEINMPGDARLAAEVANVLVDRLDALNLEYRGRKAADQRQFVQGRLDESRVALDAAGAAVTAFVTANRAYESSPSLLQRYRELEREVEAESTVWLELRRQLELAKIEERRQLTTITILDRASPPVKPSSPRRLAAAFVGALVGFMLSVVYIAVAAAVVRRSH